MKKIRRKHYISLAQAYVDQCKAYDEIEEFLSKRNITFEDGANVMMICIEGILHDLYDGLVDILYDFANDGYFSVFDENHNETKLYTVDEIFHAILGWGLEN